MQLPDSPTSSRQQSSDVNYIVPLICIVLLFFLFGFVTVLNDILIPHLKSLFSLSVMEAMLVQSCFFGAYFIMSLPAGRILAKTGNQKGIVLALGIVATGLLLFILASWLVSYNAFLLALFIVATGITILQVASNPYLSLLGPIETGATRINLAGGMNSLATTIAPVIGASLIFINPDASVEEKAAATRLPYMGMAVFVLVLAFVIGYVKLPEVIAVSTEKVQFSKIWQFPKLMQGAGAIFAYVGAEVAIGSLLIDYLSLPENGGFTEEHAAKYVSYYWGSMMIGRLAGFLFLNKVESRTMLIGTTLGAVSLILTAILVQGELAIWALIGLGLFHSVMWSCIFPISIQGLGSYTHLGASVLVMMIVGGAIIPLGQGWLVDHAGYRVSFLVELCCYAWIFWFALSKTKNVLK